MLRLGWQVVAVVLGLCVLSASAQEIARPQWTVGDSWTYRVVEGPTASNPNRYSHTQKFSVVEVRANQYRVAVDSRQEYRPYETSSAIWGVSRELNNYYRATETLPYAELLFFIWPLRIGHEWNFEHPMANGETFSYTVRVAEREQIDVPAGHFDTFRIDILGRPKAGGQYLQRRTIWYAPVAKAQVKEQQYLPWSSVLVRQMTMDLVEFKIH